MIASHVADVPPTHIVAEKSSHTQEVQLKLLLLHYDDVSAQTIITFTYHFFCAGLPNFGLLTYDADL